MNDANTTCVYEGLVCPDGFELNDSGTGCRPLTYACDPGYEINENESGCIPVPGSAVPFPFILISIFICFLVLGSYLKDKFYTKVLTNLICLIGSLEIVMYIMMVLMAYFTEEYLILCFSGLGLVSLIVDNIIFVVWYKQDILAKDHTYNKWLNFFPKTKTWFPIFCLLLNFKCGKMLYSGFFGLESTMARFDNHYSYYRILRFTSFFSFVFVYIPIIMADILILTTSKWGFQIYILAIETMILAIVITILTLIEYKKNSY